MQEKKKSNGPRLEGQSLSLARSNGSVGVNLMCVVCVHFFGSKGVLTSVAYRSEETLQIALIEGEMAEQRLVAFGKSSPF